MALLRLIRWPNLLMLAFMMVLFVYFVFVRNEVPLALNNFNIALLILSVVFIAAGGYIINDIIDVEADRINQKSRRSAMESIGEKAAYNWYFFFTIIGVLLGFWLVNLIGKPALSTLFIFTALILYLYAGFLKNYLLVGNLIVSAIVALSVLLLGIFLLFPMIQPETQNFYRFYFSILLDYALFAFIINLIREWVKDLQDIDGDYNTGRNTLPIALGRKRTQYLVSAVSLLFALVLLRYALHHMIENQWLLIYFLALVIAPLIFVAIKILQSSTKQQFGKWSLVLKFIMLSGFLSVVFI